MTKAGAKLLKAASQAVAVAEGRIAPASLTMLDVMLPPSTNNLYSNVPGVGRVKSSQYKKWAEAAAWQIKAKACGIAFPGRAHIEIVLPPDVRIDIDNAAKPLIDAIKTAGVIVNDSPKYIRRVEIRIGEASYPNGGCMVVIRSERA